MKTIIISLATALLFASCAFDINSIKGSGNVTTQTRNVNGDFTKVDASRGLDVVIEQSDATSVTVEADDNIQSHISTTVENGTLKITADTGNFSHATKKVTVKMPVINEIETGSGVSLKSADVVKSDNLTIRASSGSEIEMKIEAGKLIAESASGSSVKLSGKATTFDTDSSSGSEIEAGNLVAENVTSDASSGSSIQVCATESMEGDASSGSDIRYKGNPKKVKKGASSGGSVSAQ